MIMSFYNKSLPAITSDIDTWPDGTEVYICDPVQQMCRFGWINKHALHWPPNPDRVCIEVEYVPGMELSHIIMVERRHVFRFLHICQIVRS